MTKLSRSKIELFLECPRCFWLDVNKGIKRPPPAPYTINSAIDYLLKDEFDEYREKAAPHPLFKKYRIDAIPYQHEKMDTWRHNFTGIQFKHTLTDFLVFGAIDDVWVNPQQELLIVDYKATGAKEHQIYDSYKRQMEIYQWLFLQNGFRVAQTGYFLFARVDKTSGFSGGKLSFDLFIEPYEGDTSWVEGAIIQARTILDGAMPEPTHDCNYCQYVSQAHS